MQIMIQHSSYHMVFLHKTRRLAWERIYSIISNASLLFCLVTVQHRSLLRYCFAMLFVHRPRKNHHQNQSHHQNRQIPFECLLVSLSLPIKHAKRNFSL